MQSEYSILYFKYKLESDVGILVLFLELRYFISELSLLLEIGESGDVAEGIQDGFDDIVGERHDYEDEDGDVEMISSIVIISEVLGGVGVPGKGVPKRHYINTIIAHVINCFYSNKFII